MRAADRKKDRCDVIAAVFFYLNLENLGMGMVRFDGGNHGAGRAARLIGPGTGMIDRMIKSGLMGPAAGESTRRDARSHQGTLFTGLQLTLELANSGPPVVSIDGIEI
jgi:hypothetical protein